HGAEPLTASSAKEALELLDRAPKLDLVLMDIMMPDIDGYEATRRIRRTERYAALPIIALTAKAMPGDHEKCIEAGCTGFVPKPAESQLLVNTVRAALSPEKPQP